MKALKVIGILVLLFAFSCKKEQSVIPQEPAPPWAKFVGTYKVYDTTGVFLHDLEVSHYSVVNQYGVEVDSLRLNNFNGMFDLRIHYYTTNIESFLRLGLYNGIKDHDGNQWHLSSWYDFEETPEVENELVNDTIIFGFQMSNMAYYIQDVTPFYECRCRTVAVKQE